MKWLALFLLACAALFAAPRTEATTVCSITSVTNFAFGAVDPTAGVVNTNATIGYTCTYSGLLSGLFSSNINMCISLGQDVLGNLAPRTMVDPLGDRMQYNVYKDQTYTAIWGVVNNVTYAPFFITVQVPILSGSGTASGTITAYGRVTAGQSSLSPGSYTGTIAGGTSGTSLTYSYNEVLLSLGTFPASCTAGGTAAAATVAGPSTNATASVAAKCTVGTATDLNFGSVSGLLKTNTDQTSLIRATCTNRAAFQIGLDNGKNAGTGSIRRMASGSNLVTYELYRDSARTSRWGNTLNTDTLTSSGTGSEQTLTVYGRVPTQAAAVAGSYSDIITVTVTY
jgi:spore coat protein U-like protein